MLFFLCCLGNHAQDLAQYVNEVKRDNETLREIDQYQKSIENLVSFSSSFTSELLRVAAAAPFLSSSSAESGAQ